MIDDDDCPDRGRPPELRSIARALLEAEGCEVVGEAGDGLSAIAAVRELRPRLVLLDVQLTDLDGLEVALRLRDVLNGVAPAIVLTSSRDGSEFGPLVTEHGAGGFVPKAGLSGGTLAALLG